MARKLKLSLGDTAKEFDFFNFTKYILGYNKLSDVHKEWCREADTVNNRKLFLKPRGTYKSTIYTVAYPLWKLVHNPNERILIANATSDNAEAFLREITTHLLRNERFKEVFGKLIDSNTSKVSSVTVKTRTSFNKEPSINTVGVLGSIVSAHYSTIICDDLCNDKDRESESIREKKKKWFQDVMSILDPDGEIIVVGTRWHFNDLYKFIIEELNPKLKPEEQWDIHVESCYEEDEKTPKFPTILPVDVLDRLRIEKGPLEFSCTPAETQILMADWTTKPIHLIQKGDMLVGWDDSVNGKYSKLKPVKVLNTFFKIDTVQTFEMESGKIVRCTKDHKWYTSRYDSIHNLYTPAKEGSKLMYVCPIDDNQRIGEDEQKDWSYLAGIIDGEGSLKSSSSITITQAHKRNQDVYNKIIEVLTRLNIEYGEYERISKNKKWSNTKIIWLKNSFDIKVKLLRYTDIGKRQQLIDHNYKYGTRFILNQDKVKSIKVNGEETVYALETETGNYVAWGYASSNSQYINKPMPQEVQIFFEEDFKTFEYLGTNRVKDGDNVHEVEFVGYCDLSIGKSRSSDFTGLITLGRGKEGTVYIIDVVLQRMPPDRTMETIFAKHKIFNYRSYGVESNVFQSLFSEQMKKYSAENQAYLPIVEVGHSSNKELRIQSLQPLIKQGLLKIRSDWRDDRNYKELINQFIYFPLAGHDDGPDAVEGAFSILKRRNQWKGAPFFAAGKTSIDVTGFDGNLDMEKFNVNISSQEEKQQMFGGNLGPQQWM